MFDFICLALGIIMLGMLCGRMFDNLETIRRSVEDHGRHGDLSLPPLDQERTTRKWRDPEWQGLPPHPQESNELFQPSQAQLAKWYGHQVMLRRQREATAKAQTHEPETATAPQH